MRSRANLTGTILKIPTNQTIQTFPTIQPREANMSTIKVFSGKGGRGCHRGRRKAGLKKSPALLFLLLSQKRIQRFNDDAGNCRVIPCRIGFNSFRKHAGDLNVELFGDIITLIFKIFAVH
jgi:hypothetical protein